jgi:CBS domain-containing protein
LSDLRHVRQEDWTDTSVSEIMTPAVRLRTVTPTEDLREAIGILAANRYHQLPVVERGRVVGMLNRDHIMQYLHFGQLQSGQGGAQRAADEQTAPEPARQPVG